MGIYVLIILVFLYVWKMFISKEKNDQIPKWISEKKS